MKTTEAMISCSPPNMPCAAWLAGKAGDRIQISRGTVAMRLIVMELGRFMGLVVRCRQSDRVVAWVRYFAGPACILIRADTSILPHPRGRVV